MKYMGSKRYMLNNGLGMLIKKQIAGYQRFVDLFCGAGYVSYFVAEHFNIPILASDLQVYATVLTGAIIERTKVIDAQKLKIEWIQKSEDALQKSELYKKAKAIELKNATSIELLVKKSRAFCQSRKSNGGPIWNAYGGHYFSPTQALTIDFLIKNIPEKNKELKTLCLAALIDAASKCAAAPGHTAQPFQPTKGAKKFLYQSWQMDPFQKTRDALERLSKLKASKKGKVLTGAAETLVKQLTPKDLVFIDPPYSGVQYSRFYHVLETIARGYCGSVAGIGRYPSLEERPQSTYSNKGGSEQALRELMKGIADKKASVILTFPNNECSNGLSGKLIKKIAKEHFNIAEEKIHGHFSTLGGNNNNRPYRQKSEELLLFLQPK